jgi:UPF0755 protein
MKVMNKGLKVFVVPWEYARRWGKKKPWLSFLLATVSLMVLIHFYIALFVPPSREKVWKEVEVVEGMSFKEIAAAFRKEGVIRYRGYFEIIGRLQGISRKVRAGYYGLNTNMSIWDVLEALRKGRIIEYEIVIPEGYNLYQIGWTLSGTPLVSDPQQFIDLVRNKKYVRSLGVEADSLEGYLFPDTYYLPKGIKLEEIPKKMVQRYKAVFGDDFQSRAKVLGLSEHEVITLASIVEKEARRDSERTLISAVYHNRLKKGMKLQADPTAVYGTKAWITKVTRSDLKRRSPYNTYLRKGLPPGPIANPGEGAILAALYPDNVDYLFFVAQGDGSHFFSKDFSSHAKAISRYRVIQKKFQQQQEMEMEKEKENETQQKEKE